MTGKISHMRLNGVKNPIGYDTNSLSFSWVVDGTKAKSQKTARVIISTDPACDISKKDQLIHDSGERPDINSVDYDPKIDTTTILKPRTKYFWKVILVTDLDEKIESPIDYFETSKLNEPWSAKWISTEKVGKTTPPYVRKTFTIPKSKKVKSAHVYSTGFGLYELYINGSKPTDEYFMPFNNNYKFWVQYQTFDVTSLIEPTNNTIGVLLGDGWARGRVGFDQPSADFTRKTDFRGTPVDYATDKYELLLELHIDYEDGTQETICTDKSWKCHKSHIICNNIYDGEVQDSNLYIKNWNKNECDEKDWLQCDEVTEPLHDKLTPRFSPPVVVKERLKPIEIIKTPAGETVIDMGQNMAGWLEIKIKASKGFEVVVEHGEILQDGNFFRENIRTALQQFRYVSDGNQAVVHPHFTYYGFRYARLTNWEGEANIDDFVGCSVYSDLDMAGHLETGVPLVNKLILNGLWSQKDNFLDVPTDCPQRDERLGWTGDAQIFCETAMFNMDCYAFYRKFLKDLYYHQIRDEGIPPLWCPQFLTRDKVVFFPTEGMIGWSDSATIMPWNIFIMNGKKQILIDQYDSMKQWIEVMNKHVKNGLWDITYLQLCDWLALDGPEIPMNKFRVAGGTESTFTCSAFYYHSLTLTYKVAKILGKEDDYQLYKKRAEETLKEIRHEYFTPSGRCAVQTQTALSLAIVLDLCPEGEMKTSVDNLHKLLEDKDFHLRTGFIGTPILCRALTKGGNNQDAVTTFLQKDYPGWLYPVTMGATSMWERWDSMRPDGKVSPDGMNSFNHYAYASICEWIYCDICGLNPIEECPGFKKVILRPHPDERLVFAKASHESPMGHFECGWKVEDQNVKYEFSIPFNAEAKLVLLNLKKNEVVSSSFDINEEGNDVVANLRSGHYEITYKYKKIEYELPNRFK
ncbi:hypothetical protein M9Y10_003208 [Tritrichomonas musculus]|uniref:alpha-L-rhamnosidase n=1 Tax=Tritrichomonas musculus TaxID=1915356 RepID=A0ABR2JNW5_9EUKA